MCGLFSVIGEPRPSDSAVRAAMDVLAPRGPDAEGVWQGPEATLGHRRLAIIDLDDRAAQPMTSGCGRFRIIYNGEIYNYRELRADLTGQGHVFRTGSDTEVLLELYAREGAAMLCRLRGMFAFVIWDTLERRAFAARDPYGIKPLYYARTASGQVLFASQVRAITASQMVPPDIDPDAHRAFWMLGSVPEPRTIFKSIQAVPAGHWMTVDQAEDGCAHMSTPHLWHDIGDAWRRGAAQRSSVGNGELQEIVTAAVRESVTQHLVADVPVGVFLSGGIDSAVIAGHMARFHSEPLTGITIAYSEFAGGPQDEAPVAARVATHFGIEHYVRTVTREEFECDLPRILAAMDQPSVDGINTWYASKAASERGLKVVVSGVGGDELFLGYKTFRTLPRRVALWARASRMPGMMAAGRVLGAAMARRSGTGRWRYAADWMRSIEGGWWLTRSILSPDEIAAAMSETEIPPVPPPADWLHATSGSPAADPTLALAQYEAMNYLRHQLLRDSDWASMDHSLELRTPLVDAKLLDTLAPHLHRFPDFANKRLLSGTLEPGLPDNILNRPKTGFAIPVLQWIEDILVGGQSGSRRTAARRYMHHVAGQFG